MANNATIPTGVPVAQPVYTVDATTGAASVAGGGTQYTDGAAAPAHPIGTEIVFNNAGTMTAVSAANALPITGTISASNPSVGTDGAAIPTSSTLIGGSDGTNLQPLQVDASKNLKITGTVNTLHGSSVDAGNSSTATLTANSVFTGTSQSSLNYSALSVEVFADQASAASGLSIQQSTDGTNWDIKDAFSIVASTAFQTTVNLVGQNYRIVYTNGGTGQGAFRLQTIKQTSESPLPRALTAAGNLKVALQEDNTAGLATSANQSTMVTALNSLVTNTADLLADGDQLATIATNTANIPAKGAAATSASTPVNIASDQTVPVSQKAATGTTVTFQSGATATGAGTTFTVTGMSSLVATITGITSATVTWQGSEDGTNFSSLSATQLGTTTISTTATVNGLFEMSVAGLQSVRANITTYVSGTITVTGHAFPLPFTVRNVNANLVSSSLANTAPLPTQDQISAMIANGQGYTATTGNQATTAATALLQVFNNSTSKNVLIYSIQHGNSGGNIKTDIRLNTTADATANVNATFTNLKAGGAASAIAQAQIQYALSGATATGTAIGSGFSATNASAELLTNGKKILLPASANNGVAVYAAFSAVGTGSLTIAWVEY